jgi:hypothetical protein
MLQNYPKTQQKFDRNTYLSLKQKRLRHVDLISANNLKIPKNVKKFHVWYTLHNTTTNNKQQTTIFYISDKKENDLNPKWSRVNHSKIPHEHLTSKQTSIRIWYTNLDTLDQTLHLLLEMTVCFESLYQIIDEDLSKTGDNLLVFDMFNHHYSDLSSQSYQIELISLTNSLKLHQLNKIKFKKSYQLALIMRLNEFEKVIFNTIKNINRLKTTIRSKFNQTSRINELKTKKELYLQRIQLLKTECDRKRANIFSLKDLSSNLNEKNVTIKRSILQKQVNIEAKMKKINEIKAKNENLLVELVSLKDNLICKQKKLIKSLSKIYPIENVLKNNNNNNNNNNNEINIDQELKIANVFLPNSKFYLNNDEQQISVGLGYVSHCLLILCSILNIPLRHPIIYRASKSTIINYTHDKSFLNLISGNTSNVNGSSTTITTTTAATSSNLIVNENLFLQELALYRTNSVQEASFSYAVFLLNKNLAQLRILFDNYKNFDFNNTLGSLFWLLNHT